MQAWINKIIFITEQIAIWLDPIAFALLGAFIEEIIAPIPSPFILTIIATLLKKQNATVLIIVATAAAGATGKTLASWLYYYLADKMEDLLAGKINKLFGITQQQIEHYSILLKTKHKDYLALLFLRSVPIFPTIPVSLISGIIKIDLRTFLLTTWIGFFIRAIFFMYLGVQGIGLLQLVITQVKNFQRIILLLTIVATIVGLRYFYRRHHSKSE